MQHGGSVYIMTNSTRTTLILVYFRFAESCASTQGAFLQG
jgi:hypothetical protein